MTPRDEIAVDGVRSDGVGHIPATPQQLAEYERGAEQLAQLRTPILLDVDHPHQRLYIQAFDGTGNNQFKDPLHKTNVAKIVQQLQPLNGAPGQRIHVDYQVGPGTQDSALERNLDLVRGYTFEQNIERSYDRLVTQINRDFRTDPAMEPRFASIGFSRGASQAAGFSRLLDERGIPDLRSSYLNPAGEIQYARHLVKPGESIQALGLLDPVATGAPMEADRRIPKTVVSAVQFTAKNELRATFPSDQIVPPGFSSEGRFLNIGFPAAHSDVGGSYHRDGLSVRSGNLMVDYLNGLSNQPYLQKSYEPQDVRFNVIHQSTEGQLIYRLDPRESIRGEPSGTNVRLAPAHVTDAGPLPHQPQPMNEALAAKLTYRPIPIGAVPREPAIPLPPPASAEAIAAAGRSVPLAPKLVQGVTAVAVAYDGATSAWSAKELLARDNTIGAQSALIHFGSRNLGMVAGAEIGTAIGVLGGSESGPGAFFTGLIGGAAGMYAGNKIADQVDTYIMTHQADPQGNTWTMRNDGAWVREAQTIDWNATAYNEGVPVVQSSQLLVADKALSDRLNYEGLTARTNLNLSHPNTPRNPFEQPSSASDRPSVEPAAWTRDPATHAWSRQAVVQELEHGLKNTVTDTASPERAMQLDRAAAQTMADNAYTSPKGLAQQFEGQYHAQGWDRFGGLPQPVSDALKTPSDTLAASDGHAYTRDAVGEWHRPGHLGSTVTASGNLRDELATTHAFAQQIDAAHLADLGKAGATPNAVLSRDHATQASEHREAVETKAAMHGGDAAARGQAAKIMADEQKVARPGEHQPEHEAAAQQQARQDALRAHSTLTQANMREQSVDQAAHADSATHQLAQSQQAAQTQAADHAQAVTEATRQAVQQQQERAQAQAQQEREASERQESQARESERQRDQAHEETRERHDEQNRQQEERQEATAKAAEATHPAETPGDPAQVHPHAPAPGSDHSEPPNGPSMAEADHTPGHASGTPEPSHVANSATEHPGQTHGASPEVADSATHGTPATAGARQDEHAKPDTHTETQAKAEHDAAAHPVPDAQEHAVKSLSQRPSSPGHEEGPHSQDESTAEGRLTQERASHEVEQGYTALHQPEPEATHTPAPIAIGSLKREAPESTAEPEVVKSGSPTPEREGASAMLAQEEAHAQPATEREPSKDSHASAAQDHSAAPAIEHQATSERDPEDRSASALRPEAPVAAVSPRIIPSDEPNLAPQPGANLAQATDVATPTASASNLGGPTELAAVKDRQVGMPSTEPGKPSLEVAAANQLASRTVAQESGPVGADEAQRNPFGPGEAMEDKEIADLWLALQSKDGRTIDQACDRLAQRPEAQALLKEADNFLVAQQTQQAKDAMAWGGAEAAQAVVAQMPERMQQEAPVRTMTMQLEPPGGRGAPMSGGAGGGGGGGGGGG